MSDLVDPGRRARKQARKQAELIKRQKQKEQLRAAEAEDELSKKKAFIMSPGKRRSLVAPATGRRESLG